MKASLPNVEFLIAHLKELEHILQVCSPSVFSQDFKREEEIVLTGLVPHELCERLDTIVTDCDVTPLSSRAIETANAIGDGAFLLRRAIENGEKVIVAFDPTPTDEENFLSKYYITPPKLNEERVTLVQDDFCDARDYAHKALELLKPLARAQHFDIDSLEMQGEMYL